MAMMRTLSRIIGAITAFTAAAYLASAISMIFVEQIRLDETRFPHKLVSAGCYLDVYAVHILVCVFTLLGAEVILKWWEAKGSEQRTTTVTKWRLFSLPDTDFSPKVLLLSAFSRFFLVLFFNSSI